MTDDIARWEKDMWNWFRSRYIDIKLTRLVMEELEAPAKVLDQVYAAQGALRCGDLMDYLRAIDRLRVEVRIWKRDGEWDDD